MQFPAACPEIPVRDLHAAAGCYRDSFGFKVDWMADDIGLACVSRGESRLFLTTPQYRSAREEPTPVVLWLNLSNRGEIDQLHGEWVAAGARITDPPAAKPYKLYEFLAEDIDGNVFRVFYDFAWEEKGSGPR